ncbi:hypothetical protein V4S99_22960, partial [Citrobacter freundii]
MLKTFRIRRINSNVKAHCPRSNRDTLTPAAFSELKVPLSIKGVLRKGEDLKITDETNLDGE